MLAAFESVSQYSSLAPSLDRAKILESPHADLLPVQEACQVSDLNVPRDRFRQA